MPRVGDAPCRSRGDLGLCVFHIRSATGGFPRIVPADHRTELAECPAHAHHDFVHSLTQPGALPWCRSSAILQTRNSSFCLLGQRSGFPIGRSQFSSPSDYCSHTFRKYSECACSGRRRDTCPHLFCVDRGYLWSVPANPLWATVPKHQSLSLPQQPPTCISFAVPVALLRR